MTSTDTIFIFLALAILSLVTVSYANNRQLRRRLISKKVAQMKNRILELEDLSAILEPLVEPFGIVRAVQEELVELIQKTLAIDPGSHYLEVSLSNAQQRIETLMAMSGEHKIWRMQESDAAIAKAQYALNEAAKIVRRQQANGKLEIVEMENFIRELSWSNAMVTVTTLIGQGHKRANQNNMIKAYPFYKKAQQVLSKCGHNDERYHQFLREIGEIMSDRRKAISLSLMPEAIHNPIAKTSAKEKTDANRGSEIRSVF